MILQGIFLSTNSVPFLLGMYLCSCGELCYQPFNWNSIVCPNCYSNTKKSDIKYKPEKVICYCFETNAEGKPHEIIKGWCRYDTN